MDCVNEEQNKAEVKLPSNVIKVDFGKPKYAPISDEELKQKLKELGLLILWSK